MRTPRHRDSARCRAIVGLAAATLLASAPLLGQSVSPAPVSYRWSAERAPGAESCVDEATLANEVSSRLGRSPFRSDATLAIAVTLQRDGATWVGRVAMRNEAGVVSGSREIRSNEATCGPLGDALALAIALAIDPEAVARATTAAANNGGTSASGSRGVATGAPGSAGANGANGGSATGGTSNNASGDARPGQRPAVVVVDRAWGRAAPRVTLAVGLLPRAAVGVGLAAETQLGARWTITIDAFPEVEAGDPRFAFGLWSAGLLSGGTLRFGSRFSIALSGGVRLGALRGVVHPPTEPIDPGERFWFALGANARAIVHLVGPVSLEAGLDVLVPLTRMRYFTADAAGMPTGTPIFEQSYVAVQPALGMGFGFP